MKHTDSNALLVKSRQRVADHGEVFTPSWLVEDMLDLVGSETERIDSRFLEPACGSGNFLVPVLRRKLAVVESKYKKSQFERRQYALLCLMSIYGIEILADNTEECRKNLLRVFTDYIDPAVSDPIIIAASTVLEANIVQGDALTMTTISGKPITLPEWGYLGKGKYQRRDFRYDTLTQRSAITGTLFDELEEHEVFVPSRTYAPMSLDEIAS